MAKKVKQPKDGVIRHDVPKGWIIGFKKADGKKDGLGGSRIVVLAIPANAHAILGDENAAEKKCRASEAKVLRIESLSGDEEFGIAYGYKNFKYRTGALVKPTKKYDTNTDVTCSTGIHFFLTRELAERY